MLIAFNKPYGVVSQFTPDGPANRTLAEFDFPRKAYPIGRLDSDSEGLLLLSDEPEWNERLLHPRHAHEREYWAQVERIPAPEALKKLERGVLVQGRKTLPCRAWILDPQPEVGRAVPSAPSAGSVEPRDAQRATLYHGSRGRSPHPATARPAHPVSQKRAGLLDRTGTGRRQKPAGASHDRYHRSSDPAADARAHRKFLAGRFARRPVADSQRRRSAPWL